jgi:hypothetical protein
VLSTSASLLSLFPERKKNYYVIKQQQQQLNIYKFSKIASLLSLNVVQKWLNTVNLGVKEPHMA